jgi:predicted flap endonuclease-1-like 5' DNA nuclease
MKTIKPFAARKSRPWFWWGINIGVGIALVVWWWLENQKELRPRKKFPGKSKPLAKLETVPEKILLKESDPASKDTKIVDDLKKIEGIGPRSAEALKGAGITTFTQLAKMKPDTIQQTLKDAGVRIGYPETWPEQAALAAAEKWDELAAFQSTLQGGRKVS